MNYDKICVVCKKPFYCKNRRIVCCSKKCALIRHRKQQRIASKNYRQRQKIKKGGEK